MLVWLGLITVICFLSPGMSILEDVDYHENWWKLSDSSLSARTAANITSSVSVCGPARCPISLSDWLIVRPAWPSHSPHYWDRDHHLPLSLSEAKRFSLSQNFLVSLSRSRHQHQRPRQDSREHTTFNTQWSDLAFHSQPEHDHGS